MMLAVAVIVNSGPEIENRCKDCPCFDLFAASIRKSGPEIKNRCTDYSSFDLLAASIRKFGPEIGNRCSAIVPAKETSSACSMVVGRRWGQDDTKAA